LNCPQLLDTTTIRGAVFMTKYSLNTQLAAIQAYLNGEESYKETARIYGVNTTLLKEWDHIQTTRSSLK
jgi:transposase-like protein